jgi:hypothetical protein
MDKALLNQILFVCGTIHIGKQWGLHFSFLPLGRLFQLLCRLPFFLKGKSAKEDNCRTAFQQQQTLINANAV